MTLKLGGCAYPIVSVPRAGVSEEDTDKLMSQLPRVMLLDANMPSHGARSTDIRKSVQMMQAGQVDLDEAPALQKDVEKQLPPTTKLAELRDAP